MEPILEIKNLHFSYEDKENVLNSISFSLYPKETIGIIGPNGAGKTTLFMSICGVYRLSQGEIKIAQENVLYRDFNPKIGYVFQSPDDQLFSPTVWDDIAFGPINMGLKGKQLDEQIRKILTMCGCEKFKTRPSHHLSGGEKRMVAIASVLAMNPEILIYDEPTSNLDAKSRRRIIELIKKSQKSNIIASHDLEFILELCERVVLINTGKIIADGLAKEIMKNQQLMEENSLEVPYSLRK